jgi:hypothetical protein
MAIVLDGTTGISTPDVDSTADISANGLTVGRGAGAVSTNTAVGASALAANTTGAANTAVGFQAGFTNITGASNVFVGSGAGYASTGSVSTLIGRNAGLNTTGSGNTVVGVPISGFSLGAGSDLTTGSKNTIIGGYTGNQGGLDIRTLSNFVVLSDGDGDPVFYISPAAINGGINGRWFSASQTLGSGTNLNDIFKCGMYRVDNGASNTPTTSFYAVLVYGNGSNVTTQIATVIAGTATYVRSYNSSWSAWVQL